MPRKDLLKDFSRCQVENFPNICDLRTGEDADTFVFSYLSESLPLGIVNIQVIVPETFDYPKRHQYFICVGHDENAPRTLTAALEELTASVARQPFSQMLRAVSEAIQKSLTSGQATNPINVDEETPSKFGSGQEEMSDSDFGDADSDYDDDPHGLGEPDDDWDDGHISPPRLDQSGTGKNPSISSVDDFRRARSDLRVAKESGFRVGILGDLKAGGITCVSIRVTKLGISEEAMQAWGLMRKHYLVLMIRYCDGYKSLEHVSEMRNLSGTTEIQVALCKRYKPTLQNALLAFTSAKNDAQPLSFVPPRNDSPADGVGATMQEPSEQLETLFIGRPLNDLLRTRLPTILKYRLACGFKWNGAEQFFNDNQGKNLDADAHLDNKYYVDDDQASKRALPNIARADSLGDDTSIGQKQSLPLVAMQFLLRHFVRCTEFCLVCHCRVEGTFEALRPYVCSKPLCLYQYMALGFGPSIEWEILSQSYVVDLLVSFCYSSAHSSRLKDFPMGIGLHVPVMHDFVQYNLPQPGTGRNYAYAHVPQSKIDSPAPPSSFVGVYNHQNQEIILQGTEKCPVKLGDWMVLISPHIDGRQHCRVEEIAYFPTIKICHQVHTIKTPSDNSGSHYQDPTALAVRQTTNTPAQSPKPLPEKGFNVQCFLYDKFFDELSDDHKRQAITSLLDTLPDIETMRSHLDAQAIREPSLKACQMISESALNLLRWIIASNRSCILQVDKTSPKHLGTSSTKTPAMRTTSIGGTEDRVSGMDGWMQFRFAQGAPDKEQRFIDCVNTEAAKTSTKFPTIFAWHGSPLSNWHSIIREGLNFKEQLHGRAYGDGVYMSTTAATSIGYTMQGAYYGSASGIWPNSLLGVNAALSLNEVVNSPKDFRSRTPHYVVGQTDWIQTRYLFVKASKASDIARNSLPAFRVYDQDPTATVTGEKSEQVVIPITAVSKSRRPAVSSGAQQLGSKKVKNLKGTDQLTAETIEDAANSDVSDLSDRKFLESEDEDEESDIWDLAPSYPVRSSTNAKRSSDEFMQDIDMKDYTLTSESKATKSKIATDASLTDFVPGTLNVSTLQMLKEPSDASVTTTKKIMHTLREALKVQDSTPLHELGWYIDRDMMENMYQWIIELHSFDPKLPLAQDMKKAKLTSVVLEFRFTNDFPFTPPFVRVVRPRFLPFNQGGGGHVTAGGAICMELLTNNGWMPTNSIESVLMQIRLALSSTEPKPARLQVGYHAGGVGASYGVGEAIEAYKRACAVHGWTVPKEFATLMMNNSD